MPVNPVRLIHSAHGPGDQLSLGSTVSVDIPTLNEVENLVFVINTVPAGANEIVVVDGRLTEDSLRVTKILRTDVRIIFEPHRGRGAALRAGICTDEMSCFETRRIHGNSKIHALRDRLRCLRIIVRERFPGYDVAPI
jgi:hypothetical protein